MRLYLSCRLFAALQLTLIPICSHSADNTKDLTTQQKAIEEMVNASTSAVDLSVKLGIDAVCVPLSQDEIVCQWEGPHPETKLYINVLCYVSVDPSHKKVTWDAQNRCRIPSRLPLEPKVIEKMVNASTSAGDLSVNLRIIPDCDPLSPDEFLCQWDDYRAERSTIRIFCSMFVDQSHKKVTWDAQNRCQIHSLLPLGSSSKNNTKYLATRLKAIEEMVNASTSAGDLSVNLGIAPDCGPLIDPEILDEILCQWHDYHVEESTIRVFCSMLVNKSRTKAIWKAQDGCRIYSTLPAEPPELH
jgi:hypothetical protein